MEQDINKQGDNSGRLPRDLFSLPINRSTMNEDGFHSIYVPVGDIGMAELSCWREIFLDRGISIIITKRGIRYIRSSSVLVRRYYELHFLMAELLNPNINLRAFITIGTHNFAALSDLRISRFTSKIYPDDIWQSGILGVY